MLELRYIKETGKVTGWCGSEKRFGRFDRGRDTEEIVYLDIPIPEKPCYAYLLDTKKGELIPNPDYTEPLPPIDLVGEVDNLKARLTALEG